MSKLEELIQELCPNGVKYYKITDIATTYIGLVTTMTKHYKEEGVLLLHNSDIKENKIEVKNKIYLDYNFAEKNKSRAHKLKDVITVHTGDIGTSAVIEKEYEGSLGFATIVTRLTTNNNPYYICYFLNSKLCKNQLYGKIKGDRNNLNLKDFNEIIIPIPPIEVQNEIVRILDYFTLLTAELTAELTARKEQYDYYFKKILSLKETDYATMPLKNIGKVCMCRRIMKHQTASTGDVPFYKIGTFGKNPDSFISKSLFEEYKKNYSYPKKGDVLISCSGTIGRTVIFDGNDAYFQDSNIVWIDNDESIALNKYLFYVYKLNPFIISTGGTIPRLYNSGIENAEIKVPSIEKQKEIISILDKFDTYCNDITQGLPAEIELRQQQYEYYRDKLLTFKELK